MNDTINQFINEYRFLSNFSLCEIEYERMIYRSLEAAYQAAKTLDLIERIKIQSAVTPGRAKKLGNAITLRDDWDKIKLGVMEELLRKKFKLGSELSQKLLETGDKELIEGNYWCDGWLGQCFCSKCGNKGENHLGKLLMKIRTDLKIEQVCGE